jgi:hypothetical protein
MPRPIQSAHSRAKQRSKMEAQKLAKQLRIVAAVSVLGAASVGLMNAWEHWFPIPSERLVKVYRIHGCRCVFNWVKSLEEAGFSVKVLEVETLRNIRATLHTTENMRGCHVAAYLDYFIEGHVVPEALHKLAHEHPSALGVVTQATINASVHQNTYRDDNSPVSLVSPTGQPQPWFSPTG